MTERNDFEEIYRSHHDRIFRYLSRTAGYDDVQDLAQEVFEKAMQSISSFEGKSSIYTWLYRIATNCLIDAMRKKKKIVDRCRLSDKELFCHPSSGYLAEEFRIVQSEMNECICSYIKTLPARYRAVLVMKEYDGMPLREILQKQCDFYKNERNLLSCEKNSR